VVAITDRQLYAAATLITLGAVLDGLDGYLARLLRSESRFGAAFDYFADYFCFIVAPWLLTRALVGETGTLMEVAMGLPLVTGAIRYARNSALLVEVGSDLPGLGTVFFAFVSVTIVFLDGPTRMPVADLSTILGVAVPVMSLLMVAPVRYPKLTRFRGASPIVLVLLALMPFWGTIALATTTIVLGVLYAIVAPAFARRSRGAPTEIADLSHDRVSR
jgi:phosphatidylserine synthase